MESHGVGVAGAWTCEREVACSVGGAQRLAPPNALLHPTEPSPARYRCVMRGHGSAAEQLGRWA